MRKLLKKAEDEAGKLMNTPILVFKSIFLGLGRAFYGGLVLGITHGLGLRLASDTAKKNGLGRALVGRDLSMHSSLYIIKV